MVPGLRPAPLVFALFSISIILGLLLLSRDTYQPLHLLETDNFPVFADDMDIDSLIVAAGRQAAFLTRQDPEKLIAFGSDSYDTRWLLFSVQHFLKKLQQKPETKELNRFLQENYHLYQAGGRRAGKGNRRMLVTGYYEPVFAGSLRKSPPFLYPIYSPPKSLITLSREDGTKTVGRYDDQKNFVPYWSRAEIENQQLLDGYQLAYLKDPFDAFLLHVQGSGKIQLADKSILSVRFAGSNGLGYNSVGKLLVDENIMTLKEVNVPAIRRYLEEHPREVKRILQHNPRFIFFSWGDSGPPEGSSGERLTSGRSIAMDTSVLPAGTIGYLVSRRPEVDSLGKIAGWKKLNRFVFPQDSGAAIKGTGRVDLFWGSGNYAELAASHMKEEGALYFLVKKGYLGSNKAAPATGNSTEH